jgi:hypothetical protein
MVLVEFASYLRCVQRAVRAYFVAVVIAENAWTRSSSKGEPAAVHAKASFTI